MGTKINLVNNVTTVPQKAMVRVSDMQKIMSGIILLNPLWKVG
jgi:hypothetical protein